MRHNNNVYIPEGFFTSRAFERFWLENSLPPRYVKVNGPSYIPTQWGAKRFQYLTKDAIASLTVHFG